MAGIAITRRELTATELRAAAGKTKDSRAARRMLSDAGDCAGAGGGGSRDGGRDLRDGPPDAPRLGAPLQCRGSGRAGKPDGSAPRPAAGTRAAGRACGLRSRPVPTRCGTAWCAGGARICNTASRLRSASHCMSGRLASNWRRWVSGGSLCARSTRSRTPRRRRRLKKLPRSGSGGDPGAGTGQAA